MAVVTSGGNTFWLGGMPSAHGSPAASSAWRNGDLAILGIAQHAAEAHALRPQATDLVQRDLPFGTEYHLGWHAHAHAPGQVIRPALGQEQPQRHGHRNFTAGQRQRHQRLAVRPLAELVAILALHADRVSPLLDQRGVVHDQHRVIPAHELVGLLGQHPLQPLVGQVEVDTKWCSCWT